MPINFNNADLLSYNHRSDFLGENNIRYKTTKELTVEGNLLNLTNTSGVSGIISGMKALEVSATDWQSFIVNGINLGSGVITSITFDDSRDVREKRYSVSLEVYDSGNVLNFPLNPPYSGINYNNFRYIQNLTEKITYNRDFEKDTYNHEVDVTVLTTNLSGSMAIGKAIAANLFTSNNIFGVLGQYYNLSGKKAIYTEEYDELGANCTFGKEISFFVNSSGNYSVNKTYNYQRGTDGVTTVTEAGQIITLVEPYMDVLSAAFQYETLSSFNNCLEVYTAYNSEDSYNLESQAITRGTSVNRFERVLDYELTYTNNLNVNSGFFWEYQHESSLSNNGLIQSSENGEIVGFGHITTPKFNNAIAGYAIAKLGIESRTEDAFNRFISFNSDFNSNIFLNRRQETFRNYNGSISYQWSYNNDQNIVNDPNITRAEVTVNEGFRIPISQSFNIPNYGEIEQVSQAFEVAQKSVDIVINAKRTATINDCLTFAKAIAAPYAADFIQDAKYSWNPYSNQFNLNVTWGKIYEP